MATIIRIKRTGTSGAPATLQLGELAYSYLSGSEVNGGDRLYIGVGGVDSDGNANEIVAIGGEYFANLLDHTIGTLTASSAIITDASSKIDNLKVDNLDLNGNTISSTDANGNIVLSPNGSGTVSVDTHRITSVVDPSNPQDAATKNYVDNQISNKNIDIASDSASVHSLNLTDSDLTLLGSGGIGTRINRHRITIEIDPTGVTSGTYGSSTAVPVITVNDRGQVTSATTAALSTTLNINNDSGSSGTVSLLDSALSVVGGEGIDVAVAGTKITVSGEDATTSNKGVASFNSTNFSVVSGAVSANDVTLSTNSGTAAATLGETFTISGTTSQGINTTAAGSTVTVTAYDATTSQKGVASFDAGDFSVSSGAVSIKAAGVGNAQLENSTITLGTTTVALGGTDSDIVGLNSIEVGNVKIQNNVISSISGGYLYLDPDPVGDSAGGNAGTLVIRGNLTVQGTTTTVNSTTVSVNDKNIVLADSAANSAEADGAGITINGPTIPATFTYNGSNDQWEMNKALNLPDSIGGALFFNGTAATEAIEDHLVNNLLFAGEGIDLTYDDVANTLTVSAELATVSNPGVASFDSDQFTVTSGLVTVYELDGGTY